MILLIFLTSLLIVTLGNLLILRYLTSVRNWSQRRMLQCLVLALPLLSLGVSVSAWCLQSDTVSWVERAMQVPLFLIFLIAASAFLLNGVRLILIFYFFARCHRQEDSGLQELSQPLLQRLNLPSVRILCCAVDQPLALAWGFFRPRILLSRWMIEHLDSQELEAVLAHELHHIVQRDSLIIWLATMLRDAFFYLPTTRQAYRALQKEKELACDDLVVSVTRRPLALASALAKVWVHMLEQGKPVSLVGTHSFGGEDALLPARIERLRQHCASMKNESSTTVWLKSTSVTSLFFLLQGIGLVVLLAFLVCGKMPFLPGAF